MSDVQFHNFGNGGDLFSGVKIETVAGMHLDAQLGGVPSALFQAKQFPLCKRMVAVLNRENLARIIVEQPMLGAKILMEFVLMLSQRLRNTSGRLIEMLDQEARRGTNHPGD